MIWCGVAVNSEVPLPAGDGRDGANHARSTSGRRGADADDAGGGDSNSSLQSVMSTDHDHPGAPTAVAAPVPAIVDEAQRQLRAPWAASLAGLLFAVLFTIALIMIRSQPILHADDTELAGLFSAGEDLRGIIGGLYLAPFAGIMFLWFVAVIRDQIGEREDRFFATVFFGSGLLFVAILFVASAVASWPLVGVRYLGQSAPTAREIEVAQAMSYALMFAFGTRAAAVFLLAMSTIGLRSAVFPRWLARAGYGVGIILFVVVAFFDWIILVLPVWVALVSLYILRRERARRRSSIKTDGE